MNCITKLNSLKTLEEVEGNIGYYITKKWHHKRKMMMGTPFVDPKKAKKPTKKTSIITKKSTLMIGSNSDSRPPSNRDIGAGSNTNTSSEAKPYRPPNVQFTSHIGALSLLSKAGQEATDEYLNTGPMKLLGEEFSEYEQMRRIDIYKIENYSELSTELQSVIEQQMSLCFSKLFFSKS